MEECVCIQDLPYEILDYIFCFLTIKERIRTEQVCRSWEEIGKNCKWSWPIKLEDEMIVSSGQIITDEIWSSVMSRCGTSLKKLAMRVQYHKDYVSTKVFDIIGSNCRNLTEIVLDLCRNPEDQNSNWPLVNVTRECAKLEKISVRLEDCLGNEANIYLALKACRSLKYLELDCISCNCPTFSAEECLNAIKVPLKSLYMKPYFVSNNFHVIAEKLLSRNDPIEEWGFGTRLERFSDLLVTVVCQYEKTLKVLDLQWCHLSSKNLCEMLTPLKDLEMLSLKWSHLVDDEVVNVLAAKCKKLWALNISGTKVTDVGLTALVALPNLMCLDVSETYHITWKGLEKLASYGGLETFYFANVLNLGDGNLMEESFVELVNCSPNLRLLDLRRNCFITENLIEKLSSSLQSNLFHRPIVLHLSSYKVNTGIEVCDKLKLVFDSIHGLRTDATACLPFPAISNSGQVSPWGRRICNSWGYT